MALTYTPAAELGTACPDFKLPAVAGKTIERSDFSDKKCLCVMFICNHCPYVQAVEDRLIDLANELKDQSVGFVAICSNDATMYPDDSFENLKKRWLEKEYPFDYLHDKTQQVAKNFGAVCTPDFFVYDAERKLVYRGRLDDSWKEPEKVQAHDLKEAIEKVLNDKPPKEEQVPAMGCSIKWI